MISRVRNPLAPPRGGARNSCRFVFVLIIAVGVPEIAVVWIFKCCLMAGLPLTLANEVDEPVGGTPAVLEWWRLARYLQIGGWPDLALQITSQSP